MIYSQNIFDMLNNSNPQLVKLNIGTGKGTSVLELIKEFENANNCLIPFKFVQKRDGDIPYIVADNNCAIKKLKWKPQKTLKDMCKDSWNWKKNFYS